MGGNTQQLKAHIGIARESALPSPSSKKIIHLAFYAGWPKAMSAIGIAKQIFNG
jgi:4-carboxymuconolactone decarboxylase